MKRIIPLLVLLAGLAGNAAARDGYRITVKFTDMDLKDSIVYLAHYYGKSLPTIYKSDSAVFDKNGVAVIESKEKTLGGIYLILLNDRKTYFEFLLNNGDDISMTATSSKLPDGVVYKNSPDNEQFLQYIRFLKDFGARQQALQDEMSKAKTGADSTAVKQKYSKSSKELTTYRRTYVKQHTGTLLASIFNALEIPEVPEGPHKLKSGEEDSTFAYTYYKAHYWDHFNFKDDRLIHTPIYDAKLEEYMNKLVLPYVDSVEKESDWLLSKAKGSPELFKYTLWWLTRNAETSKIMGMDEVFVYLVENYYMKGDAVWLKTDELEKYFEQAQKIAPNVVGNVAPEIIMQDYKGKSIPLSSVKAKYTLLVFWTPDCGHCQQEIPRIDSVYEAVLKDKGVKVYAVRTEDDPEHWQKFIKEHHLEDWTNVYDPERHSDYRSKYNVYSTPVIYLLDEKKIIRGKRLDHSNIAGLVEMLEKKGKAAKTQ